MTTISDGRRRWSSRFAGIYLAVLIVALGIVAIGTTIWLSTGTSGTNVLAKDRKSVV